MSRLYARYLTSTHRDADWAAMTSMQHDCYMALLSSPELSWAGVIGYFPARYAGFAADLTERKVVKTWDELADLDKLVVDKRTGEVLVRTFIRHDNVLAKPNITKAFCRAYDLVASAEVRSALVDEVSRIHDEMGGKFASSWKVMAELLPEPFGELFPE